LKNHHHSLPHNAKKCNSAAARAGVDLYLDKQIDKESTLFHYCAKKLTTSTNSRSAAAEEKHKGRRNKIK